MPSKDRILSRRMALGLSQGDLAERLRTWWPSCTNLTVSKIERGLRNVRADELPWFAEALECSVVDLIDPLSKGRP